MRKRAFFSSVCFLMLACLNPARLPAASQHEVGNRTSAGGYVYVADVRSHTIVVYEAGIPDPAPIRVVTPPEALPGGMAVGPNGNLYVCDGNAVEIYSRGAKTLIGSIGQAQGIFGVQDVAFDSKGDLFASGRSAQTGASGVMEYGPNSVVPLAWYPSPTSQTYGIALDKNDNLFIDLSIYGAIEYATTLPVGQYIYAAPQGAPTPGGIAFVGGDMIITGANGLYILTRGGRFPYTKTGYIGYGTGVSAGYAVLGPNGSLYVPVYGFQAQIRVYAQANGAQFATYSTISRGLVWPSGVAVGPR